jgi:hypothetical protein
MVGNRRLGVFPVVLLVAAGCGSREPQGGSPTGGLEPPPQADVPEAPPQADAAEPAPQANAQVEPAVLAALDTCSVSVSLYPQATGIDDPGPGLRNVSLYVPVGLREPPAEWPDGTPVAADFDVSADAARRMLEVLAARGFFSRAARHHSEARPSPATPPPAGSTAGLPERAAEPNLEVTVRVQDAEWHSMRIASWPLGDECRALLAALAEAAGGAAGAALGTLGAAF